MFLPFVRGGAASADEAQRLASLGVSHHK